MSNRAFAPLLALFVSGCGFRLGYDLHERCTPGALDCTTDPSGVMGEGDDGEDVARGDGMPSDGDGGMAGDGTHADGDAQDEPDGGTAGPSCGSLSLLRETFDAPVSVARFFLLGQGEAGAVDGHLAIAPAAGGQATYNAQSAYDFRDAVMEVRVLRTAAAVQGIALKDGKSFDRFSRPLVPDEDGVAFQIADGELRAIETNGTTERVLARGPYDAVAQAYLRMREADGRVWFETSADRASWTTFHRAAVAMDPALVFASLFAAGGPAGAEAWFDDLNTGDAEVLGFCPISALEDSLDDDALARDLKPWNGAGDCTVEEWQGNVQLTYGGEFAACALVATPRFDLTDDLLYVEFESLFAEGLRSTMLELSAEGGARLQLTVAEGQLTMSVSDGSAVGFQTTVPVDLPRLRFLVVGESAGTLYFGTSEHGGSLETLAETPTTIDVTALTVSVWGFDSGSGESATMRIASLNLP